MSSMFPFAFHAIRSIALALFPVWSYGAEKRNANQEPLLGENGMRMGEERGEKGREAFPMSYERYLGWISIHGNDFDAI